MRHFKKSYKIVLICSLLLMLFQNATVVDLASDLSFGPSKLILLNSDLGENSVTFSQLKEHIKEGYYIGRKKREGTPHYDLILVRKDIKAGKEQFSYVRHVTDTSNSPRIHDGKFNLLTAYDPNVVWFKGTYWVAFECWGTDFDASLKFSNGNSFAKSTASSCMGPLDDKFKLILPKTRVLVMGGGLSDSTRSSSASVSKLVVHDNELYLLWTIVRINNNLTQFEQIREKFVAKKIEEESARAITNKDANLISVINNYEMFDEQADLLDNQNRHYMSVEKWRALNPKSQISDFNFYDWQKKTRRHLDNAISWEIKPGSRGMVSSPVGVYYFESLLTVGARVDFDSHMVPYVIDGKGGGPNKVVYSWNAPTSFMPVVLGPNINDRSLNRVADIFDSLKIGNDYFYTAAVGGSHAAVDEDLYCRTPTVGYSEKGCYRPAIYKTSKPLNQLLESRDAVDLESRFPQEDIAYSTQPHEYSRFDISKDYRINYVAKFVGDEKILRSFPVKCSTSNTCIYRPDTKTIVGTLKVGQSLALGDKMISPNGRYSLTVTKNGLVWLNRSTMKVITRLGPYQERKNGFHSQSQFILQTDGHLVFYSTKGSKKGVQATYLYGGDTKTSRLVLQDDGNLVQYTSSNRVVWHSRTNGM